MLSRRLANLLRQRSNPRDVAIARGLSELRRQLLRSLPWNHSADEIAPLTQRLCAALNGTPITFALLDRDRHCFREVASTEVHLTPLQLSVGALEPWATALPHGAWFVRRPELESSGLRSALDRGGVQSCLPINSDRNTLALVFFGPLRLHLSRRSKELLVDVGREIATMLHAIQLQELAAIDPLTQLARRHVAEERIVHELERSARSGAPISLIMLDIDHFKEVNDRFGHPAGDAVLRTVARVLVSQSRRIDLVARWGGEEFLIVLPETNEEGASDAAEKLRQSVEQARTDLGTRVIRVTASFGVVQIRPLAELEVEPAIDRVDRALYRAKNSGRNCVHLDRLPETAPAEW